MYEISECPHGLGNRIYQLLHIIYRAIEDKQQINIQQLKKPQKSFYHYNMSLLMDIDKIEENFNTLFPKNTKIVKELFFPRDLHRINKNGKKNDLFNHLLHSY